MRKKVASLLTGVFLVAVTAFSGGAAAAQPNKLDGFEMDEVVECLCLNAGQVEVGQPEKQAVLDAIDESNPNASAREQASGGGDDTLTSTFRNGKKPPKQREQCILAVDCLDKDNKVLKTEGVGGGQAKKIQCPKGTTRVITFCSGREESICHYGWK